MFPACAPDEPELVRFHWMAAPSVNRENMIEEDTWGNCRPQKSICRPNSRIAQLASVHLLKPKKNTHIPNASGPIYLSHSLL